MTLVGLDLNATRARAVAGPSGDFPLTVPLEPPLPDLHLSIQLGDSAPAIGLAGVRLCRRLPHLVCQGFLPSLGEADTSSRAWLNDPHRLNTTEALSLVLERLQGVLPGSRGLVVAVPDYLTPIQVELLRTLAEAAQLPVLGSLPGSMAAALAAFADRSWFGTAVLVDIDDHALTLATVQDADGYAHLLDSVTLPHLGLRLWQSRLLDALADCCILQSRRDPRDSPAAEQSLYEQLDGILAHCKEGRMVNVAFQTAHWYQNLILQPEDTVAFCAPLVRQVMAELSKIFRASWPKGPPRVVLLTAAMGMLPGLIAAVQGWLETWESHSAGGEESAGQPEEDFGKDLLAEAEQPAAVVVLSPDAAARGAHGLVAHFQSGDVTARHLENSAPLPLPQPPDAGPARLHFQGQDYLLRERSFTLGRHPDCDLVFDKARYPDVSPWHCEILYDPRTYVLRDRSREGTWVNDQPVTQRVVLQAGDSIRLGPVGPVLRFLGQPGIMAGGQRPAASGR